MFYTATSKLYNHLSEKLVNTYDISSQTCFLCALGKYVVIHELSVHNAFCHHHSLLSLWRVYWLPVTIKAQHCQWFGVGAQNYYYDIILLYNISLLLNSDYSAVEAVLCWLCQHGWKMVRVEGKEGTLSLFPTFLSFLP